MFLLARGAAMSRPTRRDFLFVSTGAAFGNLVVPGLAESADTPETLDFSASGLVTGQIKPLTYREIPGLLSAAQVAPHHQAHYGGALRAYVGIEAAMENWFESGEAIQPNAYAKMQELKSSRANSVLLHELYFDGLTPQRPDPAGDVREAIARRFGSLDRWVADFQASAKAASGWAMLVVHPANGKLYNVVSHEHAHGPMWMAMPLVVIDVYEHAFYVDYQYRKGEYVEKFVDFIDWDEANRRFRSVDSRRR